MYMLYVLGTYLLYKSCASVASVFKRSPDIIPLADEVA